MKRIKQLSKHLINQIAAGEVIERPASVVKELVENSIDAGATKISVEISNDCRDIRIADNGSGIHPDDIELAFTKHATSKIESDEDLFNINTLGFRGEALASIISISDFLCITRTKDFDYGTKISCNSNSEIVKTQTGCAIGTIIEVKNLFYNLPARLKFLKNPKTEFSYIQELVQALAVINPNVSFELKNNGKTLFKTNGLSDLKECINEVYSKDVVENLNDVLKTDKISGFKISGFVSIPTYFRSSKKGYHLYINSRVVKCPVFQKAIDTVYKNLIGIGKYPFVVLNLEIPPSEIDVNVHPTKKEVRYKNTNQIFNFIYTAIDGALGVNNIVSQPLAENHEEIKRQIEEFKTLSFEFNSQKQENDDIYVEDFVKQQDNLSNEITTTSFVETSYTENKNKIDMQNDENIIGQYKNTYILIENEDGLEIVDQHIADERYIYEQLKKNKQNSSQILFVSDVLSVSPVEASLIKENIEKFEKFGYGIEFLKNNELIFKKIPQLLARANLKDVLADLLENLQGNLDNLEEKILITTSCRSAVKANQRLNLWEMQTLIKKWRSCEKPYTCPHGRPISKIIPHKELASFFERNK